MKKLLEYLHEPNRKYRLLPDQVERIKKRINRLEKSDYKDSNEKEIEELKSILKRHIPARIHYDYINIGTCFTVTEIYLGKRTTGKYQLVDFLETLNNHYDETGEYTRITLDSLIGQAVYGKKVGETFNYSTNPTFALAIGEKAKISFNVIGMIEDIKTPTKETSKKFK